jgi:hypothetical protein
MKITKWEERKVQKLMNKYGLKLWKLIRLFDMNTIIWNKKSQNTIISKKIPNLPPFQPTF